ncbi:hypothetical protein RM96_31180 [Cupriavidus sp. IDO]|nr:hypothetical protein RM96_31180 [Cupriavidus sp. IDO]
MAELRSRFPETRAMYREVCWLLFFSYGVTSTANKRYSLVRKGNMGTPAEVLQPRAVNWPELRTQFSTELERARAGVIVPFVRNMAVWA